MRHLQGRVSIPDGNASNLIAPGNREWRSIHQGIMTWVGAISILGMVGLLLGFYVIKGRIRMAKGPAGQTITRFNGFERFTHWLTATTFLVLAASGLNITFGKYVIQPWLGDAMFGPWSQFAKFCHNYLAWPFMLGLVFMLLVWIKDNIPNGRDVAWLKAGGGFIGNTHPEAERFNAGQKLIFWSVVLGGGIMTLSGLMLMFPFQWTGLEGLQTSNIVHGVIGMLLVAAMLAHIYIGSVGMEGAFDAMGTGEVDVNWAREHHGLWVDEQIAKQGGTSPASKPMAAE